MNVHILDIKYCDLLQKQPEIRDVFDIIKKDIASKWHEVGGCLGISLDYRDSLKGNNSVNTKLERILTEWIQNETKDVTWKVALEMLKELRRRDLVKSVISFLETPQIYKKYNSKRDYFRIQRI